MANIGGGDILQLNKFIDSMNELLKQPINIQNHVETPGKGDVLGHYNLIATPEGSQVKDFSLKFLLRMSLWQGGDFQDAKNIADVVFESANVSLKFIAKGSKVTGSYETYSKHLKYQNSMGRLSYIIGKDIPNATLNALQFVINREVIERFESTMANRLESIGQRQEECRRPVAVLLF